MRADAMRLKALRGICVRCSQPHDRMSTRTGQHCWRCSKCQLIHQKEASLREAGLPSVCDCGNPIERRYARSCDDCRSLHRRRTPVTTPAPRHVRHYNVAPLDAIAASLRWRHVL